MKYDEIVLNLLNGNTSNQSTNTFLNELRVYLGLKCGFCKLYNLFVYILPKFVYYTIF